MPIPKSLLAVAGPVAPAARALVLAREGQKTLVTLRDLPPDSRAALERDAAELGVAVARVTEAARAEVLKNHHRAPADWKDAREQALHPGPDFALAKQIVEAVRAAQDRGHPMGTTELAKAVGAIGKDDGIFRAALHIAEGDGYIERTVGRHWRPTELASAALSEASHIKALEERIIEQVEAAGLIDTEDLAHAVGCDGQAATEFRAALHRAVISGRVSWLNWSTYGLPPDRLAQLEAKASTGGPVGQAVPDLHAEVEKAACALRAIRQTLASSGHDETPPTPGALSATLDPASRLRRLAELHVAGLIDDGEYQAKRAELVQLL